MGSERQRPTGWPAQGFLRSWHWGLSLSDEKPDVERAWETAIGEVGWEGGNDTGKGLELGFELEGQKTRDWSIISER